MWTFLSVVAVCGTVVYLWREVRDAVYSRVSALNIASGVQSKLVSAQVEEFERAQTLRAKRAEPEPIPLELFEYAQEQSGGQSWAEEDIIAEALERKERLGSWDKVMASYSNEIES